jgi:hypothetical protein
MRTHDSVDLEEIGDLLANLISKHPLDLERHYLLGLCQRHHNIHIAQQVEMQLTVPPPSACGGHIAPVRSHDRRPGLNHRVEIEDDLTDNFSLLPLLTEEDLQQASSVAGDDEIFKKQFSNPLFLSVAATHFTEQAFTYLLEKCITVIFFSSA